MLLQQTAIPDNLSYLLLGLAMLALILGGYLVSYFVRLRNIRREAALLEQMQAEAPEAPGVSPASARLT